MFKNLRIIILFCKLIWIWCQCSPSLCLVHPDPLFLSSAKMALTWSSDAEKKTQLNAGTATGNTEEQLLKRCILYSYLLQRRCLLLPEYVNVPYLMLVNPEKYYANDVWSVLFEHQNTNPTLKKKPSCNGTGCNSVFCGTPFALFYRLMKIPKGRWRKI